ncbi:MAG TPA: Clp protease N-terminal domain-containing protein [Nocardioides sp.]|uniref:Clp protease N-terminal domain-containing protein n=1 Tax=Nocardioides sp. TaxID=35761 RepID=UPI002E301722|nr:Clp protease N-terminal domain-containing protein [Nocardioides sp.]HEX3933023.1 Clp protease N-terminal domain-containing protein [Nocardioides sp.]
MTKHSQPADAWNPWSTYIDAREEARRRGDRKVGTEHLILGLLREPVLAQALGCDLQTARDALDAMDHDALAAVGIGAAFHAPPIPIDEPIKRPSRPTLKAVLRDRLPMTPAAKTALENSYKERRRGHHIPPQQVLLTILELKPPDPAAELIAALGVDRAAVRERLGVGRAAA